MLSIRRPIFLVMWLIISSLSIVSPTYSQDPITIMPLGDSITQARPPQNSYRRPLWHLLQNAGYNFDFVGNLQNGSGGPAPNPDFDLDHEGHWGWTVDQMLGYIDGPAASHQPDIVLLHLGTNDIRNDQTVASTIDELGQLIDKLRNANPQVTILLAQIIPHNRPPEFPIEPLNVEIPGLAAAKNTPSSPVIVVDQYTGFDVALDTYDDVHPNNSGEDKMAQRWFETLQTVLPAPGNVPPSADAGTNIVVTDTDENGEEIVTLDGTASLDTDGTIVSYLWTAPDTTQYGGATPSVTLSVGTHLMTLLVTDDDGATDTDIMSVTVNPGTPPIGRVTDNLLALYSFEESSGSTIFDVSGVGVPLDLTIANSSAVTHNVDSLTVSNSTIIQSGGPAAKITDAVVQSNELTLEAWVATDLTNQTGPARMVTISRDGSARNVTLGQSRGSSAPTSYSVRTRSTQPGQSGKDYTYTWTPEGVVVAGQLRHVVFTRDATSLARMYVDGVMVTDDVVLGNFSNWDNSWELALANELGGSNRPWLGTFHLVAFYSQALTAQQVLQNFNAGPQTGPPPNQPPTAEAGTDILTVDSDDDGFETVVLDGTGSSDSDGTIVSYLWTAPDTTQYSGATPSVTLSVGSHLMTLLVTDDDGATDTDTMTVTVNAPPNQPPTAEAGSDISVTDTDSDGLELVVLDGTGSSDSDGTIVTYLWTDPSNGQYSGASPTVVFGVGSHLMTLLVTDDDGATDTDTMTVTVNAGPPPNQPPTAEAGADIVAIDNDGNGLETVILNGTGSLDTDGTIVSYVWTAPDTTQYSGATPSVTLPVGTHLMSLLVTDDEGATGSDTMTVTVHAKLSGLTGTIWGPFLEWEVQNPTYQGNPFDLVATVLFTHTVSGTVHQTEMFYAQDNAWRFRFTGTETGLWNFVTNSADPDLHGYTSSVTITPNLDPNSRGFVTNNGQQWAYSASGQTFVPQLAMAGGPHYYAADPTRINTDINMFLGTHQFNGLHTLVLCRWFDLSSNDCSANPSTDPNPDPATFDILEQMIHEVYDAGGIVHIWAWGDATKNENPGVRPDWGGLNGAVDQRLQRYIAARLGPIPGWTMGYGFDIFEWATTTDLDTWHSNMQAHLGWGHMLGARSSTNQLNQLSEQMDFSSYEQHEPDYNTYVQTMDARPSKPSFSEDRFRLRNGGAGKDYVPDQIRRGLWHSTMAGGVANIWGNLEGDLSSNTGDGTSLPFPNVDQIRTHFTFWDSRFPTGVVRCNAMTTAGTCLEGNNGLYVFYVEDSSSLDIDLSGIDNQMMLTAVAVDTKAIYQETPVTVSATAQVIDLGYMSDWAIAVYVSQNSLPTANAGLDQTVYDSDSNGTEAITLDGSLSSGGTSAIVSASWELANVEIASGIQANAILVPGIHDITLIITNKNGDMATDTVTVTVLEPQADLKVEQSSSPALVNYGDTVTYDILVSNRGAFSASNVVLTNVLPAGMSPVTIPAGCVQAQLTITCDLGTIVPSANVSLSIQTYVEPVVENYTLSSSNVGNVTLPNLQLVHTLPTGSMLLSAVPSSGICAETNGVVTCDFGSANPNTTHTVDVMVAYSPGATLINTATVSGTPLDPLISNNTATNSITLGQVDGNQLPVANAGIDTTVYADQASTTQIVTLDGFDSYDPDGRITSYAWTENAVEIATGSVVNVSLPIGSHTLVLTVTDNDGNTSTDTVNVNVEPYVNRHPFADAGSGFNVFDDDLTGEEVVILDGSSSYDPDGTIVSYTWLENNLVIATGMTTTTSLPLGSHTILLAALDNDGGIGYDTIEIGVWPSGNIPPTADAGQNITLTDLDLDGFEIALLNGLSSTDTDGSIVSFLWTAPDTTQYSGATPGIALGVGTHLMTLLVTDDDGATDTDTMTVTVNAGPPPNQSPTAEAGTDILTVDSDNDGSETVVLDGTGSSDSDGTIVSYLWTAPDTIEYSGATPSVTLSVGSHLMTLLVTDDDGATDTDTMTVTVNAPPPNQSPTAEAGTDILTVDTDNDGSETIVLDGTGSSDSDGTIVSYLWTAPDTTEYSGATPSVTLSVGSHLMTLLVTDDDGATDTDTMTVTVNAPPPNQPPTAEAGTDILAVDTDNDGSETVVLDGTGSSDSDGTIVSYLWTAPDTTEYNGATPSVTLSVGSHLMTLLVTDDDGATDTDTMTVTVNAPPNQSPTAEAGTDILTVDLDNDGSETVVLDGTGSSDSDGTIVSYLWTAPDTTEYNGATPSVTLSVGSHLMTLLVTDDDGATDTDTMTVTVNAPPNQTPTAEAGTDILAVDSDNNGSETVVLDGTGSSDSDGTIASYLWTAPDTTQYNGATPSVTLSVGSHLMTLLVTDDDGATDTDTMTVTVNAPPNQSPTAEAGADILAVDTDNDGSQTVVLDGTGSSDSDGTIVSYLWTAPDTTQYNGATPSVTLSVGSHLMTLLVTDDDGATDTDTMTVTVNPGTPPTGRITDDLLVLYTFEETDGNTVFDVSGVGTPLNLTIANLSAVTHDIGSLTVNSPTIIQSGVPADKITNAVVQSNELTLEAWVATDLTNQTGPARMVTISQDGNARNITLGQSRGSSAPTSYSVRTRSTQPWSCGQRLHLYLDTRRCHRFRAVAACGLHP